MPRVSCYHPVSRGHIGLARQPLKKLEIVETSPMISITEET
jgi:hypothetical protein